MPKEHRDLIYENGGIAEQLLRQSFRRVMGSSKAIWGHIGDPKALKVDLRVGFKPTGHPNLYVIWNDQLVQEHEKPGLIEKALALGVF